MGITATFTEPLYTGVASVPSATSPEFPVYLAGHGYLLDLQNELTYAVRMKHESIPLTAQQVNTGNHPGAATINQEDLWRYPQESWHLGAGQQYADREDSLDFRFNSSQGVDPWTRWQLSLLHDTAQSLSSAETNLYLTVAGTYLYATDGAVLRYSTNGTSWTAVTGEPSSDARSVASDGYTIYTAYGSDGIYTTTRGAGSQSSWATGDVSVIRYLKGRVMAFDGGDVYNVTGSGALPSALFTHGNTDFTWVDAAEGPDFIYMAGYSGDKSLIYRTAIKDDATGLDAPTVAGELPDGEVVRSLQGYLGFLMIGTDKGVRVAQLSNTGAVKIGPLILTDNPVYCFEPQERFCWYGLSNFTGTSTGLGRLDLSLETLPGQPPYVSDLMVEDQGDVLSAVTFGGMRYFTVSGSGVWGEADTYVAEGHLDTGLIDYGISEQKTAIQVSTESAALPEDTSYSLDLAANGNPFVNIGIQDQVGGTVAVFTAAETKGRRFELRITMTGGVDSPVFYRVNLLADPSASLNEILSIPLLLHEQEYTAMGARTGLDVVAELTFLKGLRESRAIVGYQEGRTSYTGVVKDYVWYPYGMTDRGDGMNGTCFIEFKTIP